MHEVHRPVVSKGLLKVPVPRLIIRSVEICGGHAAFFHAVIQEVAERLGFVISVRLHDVFVMRKIIVCVEDRLEYARIESVVGPVGLLRRFDANRLRTVIDGLSALSLTVVMIRSILSSLIYFILIDNNADVNM